MNTLILEKKKTLLEVKERLISENLVRTLNSLMRVEHKEPICKKKGTSNEFDFKYFLQKMCKFLLKHQLFAPKSPKINLTIN